MDEGDEYLVDRIRKGDKEAFRKLARGYFPLIQSFVRKMNVLQEDSEDIIQEVFLRLWKFNRSWNPRKASLSTWLHSIAHHLCVDLYRKNSKTSAQADEKKDPLLVSDQASNPAERVIEVETGRQVQQALNNLPERQRTAIVLCHYQSFSNKDAALIMGISVDALESLLARGRHKLRDSLSELITVSGSIQNQSDR